MKTQTHYVSFRKFPSRIRLEFAIPATNKQEARTIAERELARPSGYRYQGVD